jgi:hypothetical protein
MTTEAAPQDDAPAPEWNEPFLPPPWSAVQNDDGLWEVTCDGYDDEMPIVFAGTASWPLSEADAHIGAAALDLRDALQEMIDTYWRGSEDSDDEHAPSMVRKALRALAKSRGEG